MGKCEGEPAGESTRAGVWSMLNGAGGEEHEEGLGPRGTRKVSHKPKWPPSPCS